MTGREVRGKFSPVKKGKSGYNVNDEIMSIKTFEY